MSISNLEIFTRRFERLEKLSALKAFKSFYLRIVTARELQIKLATDRNIAVADNDEAKTELRKSIGADGDTVDDIIDLAFGFEEDLMRRKVNRDAQRQDVRQKDYVALLTRLAVGADLRVDQFFDLESDNKDMMPCAPVSALHNAAAFGAIPLVEAQDWARRFQRDGWLKQADPVQFHAHKLGFILRALHGADQIFQVHQMCVDLLLERGPREASYFKAASNWLQRMGDADNPKNSKHASLFLLRTRTKENEEKGDARSSVKQFTAGQVDLLTRSFRALMDYQEQILHLGLAGVAPEEEGNEVKAVASLIKERLETLAKARPDLSEELKSQWHKRELKSMMRNGRFLEVRDKVDEPGTPTKEQEVQRLFLLGECALERGQSLKALVPLLQVADQELATTELGARTRLLLARAFKHLGCNHRAEWMLVRLDKKTRGLIDEPLQARIRMQIARLKASLLSRHSREYIQQVLRVLDDPMDKAKGSGDSYPIHMRLRLDIEVSVIREKQGMQFAGSAVTKACRAADALASLSRHRWLESARADLEVLRLLRRAGRLVEVERRIHEGDFLKDLWNCSGWHYVEACHTLARMAHMRRDFVTACVHWIEVLDWSCAGFETGRLTWVHKGAEHIDWSAVNWVAIKESAKAPVTAVCDLLKSLKPEPTVWVAWDLILQAVSGLAEAVRSQAVAGPVVDAKKLDDARVLLKCALEAHDQYRKIAANIPWLRMPPAGAKQVVPSPPPPPPPPLKTEPPKKGWLGNMVDQVLVGVGVKSLAEPNPQETPQAARLQAASEPVALPSDEHVLKLTKVWEDIEPGQKTRPKNLIEIETDWIDAFEADAAKKPTSAKKRRSLRERLLLQLQREQDRLDWAARASTGGITALLLEPYVDAVSASLTKESFVDHLPSVTLRAIADGCHAILVKACQLNPETLVAKAGIAASWLELRGSLLKQWERPVLAVTAMEEILGRFAVGADKLSTSLPGEMVTLLRRLVNDCYAPTLLELRQSDQSDVYEAELNRKCIDAALESGLFLFFDPQHCRRLLENGVVGQHQEGVEEAEDRV